MVHAVMAHRCRRSGAVVLPCPSRPRRVRRPVGHPGQAAAPRACWSTRRFVTPPTSRSSALPVWTRWVLDAARPRTQVTSSTSRSPSAARHRPGDILSWTTTAHTVVPAARANEVAEAARAREAKEARQARQAPGRKPVLRPATGLREVVERCRGRPPRAGRAADPARRPSLEAFFVDLSSAWRSRPARAQSVFLRGWGDYQRWSLKLTESASELAWDGPAGVGRAGRSSGACARSRPPASASAG